MHDEKYFEEPDKFIPERFLKTPFGTRPGVEDDPARRENLTFGGGRRICPGAYTARLLLVNIYSFILISSLILTQEIKYVSLTWYMRVRLMNRTSLANFIWAFEFSPARKPSGEIISPDLWNFKNGISLAPEKFKATITVRSAKKKEIIQRHFVDQAPILKPFEQDLEPEDAEYVRRTRS
jgi:hypothetical protein